MAITAALVKELRELTGAGMMDAKKALTEVEGNIEAAIDWLRTKGLAKAAKKAAPRLIISASCIQTAANPAPRKATALAKARKWREGSSMVRRRTASGWLSMALKPPDSMMMGMMVITIRSANCAMERASVPSSIPIAAAAHR